jgi:predicted transcriptional regulator
VTEAKSPEVSRQTHRGTKDYTLTKKGKLEKKRMRKMFRVMEQHRI